MFAPATPRAASTTARVARLGAVSGGGVAASAGAHVLAGGAVPRSCVLMLSLLVTAAAATGVGARCAQRNRGPWTTLGVLALGQVAMTVILSVPSPDHAALWTLPSAVLHAAATAGLGAVLLGTERVMAGAARLMDLVMPLRRPDPVAVIVGGRLFAPQAVESRGVLRLRDRTLRGPPRPA